MKDFHKMCLFKKKKKIPDFSRPFLMINVEEDLRNNKPIESGLTDILKRLNFD